MSADPNAGLLPSRQDPQNSLSLSQTHSFSKEWLLKKKIALQKRERRLYRMKLAKIAVEHWKYVARERLALYRAKKFYAIHTTRKVLHQWKHAMMVAKGESILKGISRTIVLGYFFNEWLSIHQRQMVVKDKERIADRFHSISLKRRGVTALKQHAQRRRITQTEKQSADTLLRANLLRQTLATWRQRYHDEQKQISEELQAKKKYRSLLLRKVWNCWCVFVEMKCIKTAKWRQAVRKSYLKTLRVHWDHWTLFVQQREERKQNGEISHGFYLALIRKRAFSHWKEALTTEMELNSRVLDFQSLRNQRIMRDAIYEWKSRIVYFKEKRIMKMTAYHHHHTKLLTKFLYTWKLFVSQRKDRKNEVVLEVLNAKKALGKVVKKQCFDRWFIRHKQNALESVQIARAEAHYRKQLMSRAITCLRDFVIIQKSKQAVLAMAKRHYLRVLQRRAVRAWRDITPWLKRERLKRQRASYMYRRLLIQRLFRAWRSFILLRKAKKQEQDEAMQRRTMLLLRKGVTRWLEKGLEHRARRVSFALQQQTANTTKILRLVERIARHWRQLVLKRKAETASKGLTYLSSGIQFTPGHRRSACSAITEMPINKQQSANNYALSQKAFETSAVNQQKQQAVPLVDVQQQQLSTREDRSPVPARPPPRRPIHLLIDKNAPISSVITRPQQQPQQQTQQQPPQPQQQQLSHQPSQHHLQQIQQQLSHSVPPQHSMVHAEYINNSSKFPRPVTTHQLSTQPQQTMTPFHYSTLQQPPTIIDVNHLQSASRDSIAQQQPLYHQPQIPNAYPYHAANMQPATMTMIPPNFTQPITASNVYQQHNQFSSPMTPLEREINEIEQALREFELRRQLFVTEKAERKSLRAKLDLLYHMPVRDEMQIAAVTQQLHSLELRAYEYQQYKEYRTPHIKQLALKIEQLKSQRFD